jgi:hypothetical protein
LYVEWCDPGCKQVGLKSFVVSIDYRDYMGSSSKIWASRCLFLYLCSYNLVGSVTQDPLIDGVHHLIAAAAVLHHQCALPRSLKRITPQPQKSESRQPNHPLPTTTTTKRKTGRQIEKPIENMTRGCSGSCGSSWLRRGFRCSQGSGSQVRWRLVLSYSCLGRGILEKKIVITN